MTTEQMNELVRELFTKMNFTPSQCKEFKSLSDDLGLEPVSTAVTKEDSL